MYITSWCRTGMLQRTSVHFGMCMEDSISVILSDAIDAKRCKSNKMSMPEIPGYFYDESRKRYFKITNGDQRHNSTYSNNAVRAIERRKDGSVKQSKKRPRIVSAEMKRSSGNFSDWVLQRRLGCGSKIPSFANRFLSSGSAQKISDWPAWPFTDNKTFLAKNSTLELYDISEDSNYKFTKLVASHSFLLDLQTPTPQGDRKQIEQVATQGEWVFCRFQKFVTISRWQQNSNNNDYRVLDFTNNWIAGVAAQGSFSLLREILSCQIYPLFTQGSLVLYSDNGHEIVISLEPFRVCSVKSRALQVGNSPLIDAKLTKCGETLCYNTGPYLVLCNIDSRPERWDFHRAIYSYFVTDVDIHSRGQDVFKVHRFFIITSAEVIIRDVVSKSLEQLGSDLTIPIRNDNQARPISYRRGSHLLIEEREGLFKLIDVKKLVVTYAKIGLKIHSPRDAVPRVIEAGNTLYISTSKCTYLVGNLEQTHG